MEETDVTCGKTVADMDVSIVICTKNEERNIEEALDSLVENDVINQNVEVIIVDGYSTDKTAQVAAKYPVKLLYESIGTRGGASNAGWKNAKGDIVVYTNADCLFRRNWIPSILKSFDSPKTAAVGGVDLTPLAATSYFERASGLLDELRIFPKHGLGQVFRLRGCNVAYKKSALMKSDGFDERFNFAEETELQYRLHKMGYNLVFDGSIIVYHKRRSSLIGYWKQFHGCGYGKFQLLEKHPSSIFVPEVFILPLLPSIFLISIIAYLMDNIIFLPLLLITILFPVIYAVYTVIKVYLHVRSLYYLPGVLVALFVRNIASMVGFFYGALSSMLRRVRSIRK